VNIPTTISRTPSIIMGSFLRVFVSSGRPIDGAASGGSVRRDAQHISWGRSVAGRPIGRAAQIERARTYGISGD
ncbi:MAG: hypothetical protein ACKVIW_16800, partial [bacterium]